MTVSTSLASPRPNARYRGRFAPSPTGPLHFGSLIAAVASYADARAAGGEWLVRIEDVDTPRARFGAEAAILRQLERYGFECDGAIVRQSERLDLYQAALERLDADHLIYACTCTRRELETAPLGRGGERVYAGTCRNGVANRRAHHASRIRVGNSRIDFRDRLQGTQAQDLAIDVGDFVLRRSDGYFAYQLAVVVDDAAQGITDVARGSDLLASTPRQIFLQHALGLPTPRYLHVPIAINGQGEKLSKQTRARPLPDAPLQALAAAWRFLDQPEFPARGASVAEFWSFATVHWSAARLPPIAMLPAPERFCTAEGVPDARV